MAYVDGFVIAVPTARKPRFIDHAGEADSVSEELGATRILECQPDLAGPPRRLRRFRVACRPPVSRAGGKAIAGGTLHGRPGPR